MSCGPRRRSSNRTVRNPAPSGISESIITKNRRLARTIPSGRGVSETTRMPSRRAPGVSPVTVQKRMK
jgi:hypothetical protein